MEVVLLLIRLFLAAIFALAGIGKLLDLEGSEKALQDFGAPDEVAKPLAVGLPVAEIVVAVLLLPVSTAWFGALGGFLLLLIFIAGMLWQMAQGNAPDCHCFGRIHSEPVSVKSLLRNAIFAILSFFLIVQGTQDQGLSLLDSSNNSSEGNVMSLILGFAVVGLLAAAVYFLKTISEQQTQIMRRIEVLELTTTAGDNTVKREDVALPKSGLLIGTPAPPFELPDINGRQTSLEKLLAFRKPQLFFFVSPNCAPCAALLPEIENWQNDLKSKVDFIFISSGKVKDNLDKFAGASLKQILLQKDKEVIELFGGQWTPTVLLVNAEGKIASRLAVGDKAIRELVENVKNEIDNSKTLLIAPLNGSAEKLKPGDALPAFSLPDVANKTISSNDLHGSKTLITFWSTTCGFCNQMLEDLRAWNSSKNLDEPNLLLLSEGDAENHQNLNLPSMILLDQERDVSNKLGMEGTPSAFLVNEEGRIISEMAIGADQIWTLLGRKK